MMQQSEPTLKPCNPLCEQYAEAKMAFSGAVWVPDDLERITL